MSEERSLRDTLAQTVEEVPWNLLQSHAKKGRLLILHESLDLVTVAMAVAQDNLPEVEGWIRDEKLRKPDLDDFGVYGSEPQAQFQHLIVQPFVLAKVLAD